MADGYSPIPGLGMQPSLNPAYYGTATPRAVGQQQSDSVNQSQSTQSAQNQAQSDSFIPDFSQTPILEEIAKYAESMAPQVYDWGMQQFTKNQGNIDNLMRAGQEWASPAHIAAQMGQAEAGVQQAGEQGRQAALQDLQSYGIDPSAGRYASLDNASRVQTAAAAAGAGNQQRNADIAQGLTMQNQAMSAGLQNTQTGYGAANAMNSLLGTGMSLKYSPLGTTSRSAGTSSAQATSSGSTTSQGYNLGAMPGAGGGGGGGGGGSTTGYAAWGNIGPGQSAPVHVVSQGGMAASGGYIDRDGVEPPGHQYGGAVRRGKRKGRGRMRMQKPQRAKGGGGGPQDEAQDSPPTAGAPQAAPAAAPPPGYGDELPMPQEGAPQAPLTALPQEGPAPPPDQGYRRGGPVDPIAQDIERQTGKTDTSDDDQYGLGGYGDGGSNGDDDNGFAGGGVVGTTASGFVPTAPVAAPAGYTTAAPVRGFARGGSVGYGETTGGFVSQALSPSNGKQVDDVPARLNEGEYVIPRDVVHWKGKDFFHKLIAQSRKTREQHGAPSDDRGYNFGGPVQQGGPGQGDGSGFNLGGAI
jgi:hypothetical protein